MARPRLTLHLLGSSRIERDGKPIEVDTRKAVALLAYLALNGGRHERDKLAGFFWPETYNAKALGALRRTLSVLNKALGGIGLMIERETVGFEIGPEVWLDVAEFRRLARGDSISALADCAALYRDDFMAGFTLRDSPAFDDWQFFQSEGLRRELASVLEKLVRIHAEDRDYESAITAARRWLGLDSLHEPAHRALMLCYAQSGQHAAALRQYRECARVLNAELGVGPLEETTQLYEAIKDHRLVEIPTSNLQPPTSNFQSPISNLQSSIFSLPLVGRTAELKALLNACEAGNQFIVLEGEAGIGKTRLAEEALAYLQRKGGVALTARCYAGQAALAYGPFIEGLRAVVTQPEAGKRLGRLAPHHRAEAARLLPELITPDLSLPPSLESPGAQSRFLEGLRQTLLALCHGSTPGVLFVDDVQWADDASLDFIAYLARRQRAGDEAARQTPLTLLFAWRSEDVPEGARPRTLLAEAGRAHNGRLISLSRLSQPAVAELVAAARPEGAAYLVERLYRETEGSPFFVVEYLAALASTEDWALPVSVRDLLSARLSGLGEAGGQLFGAAAIIGRSFEVEMLQAVSGRSEEETVAALEELTARGLVIERETNYDFSHEKLRALAYDQISLARRRLLHKRAAEALVNRARGQRGSVLAGQIAGHFQLGGNDAGAAHYFKLAGDHARALYANAEALAHFRAALGLGHPETAALHEAIGDLQTLAGDYGAALKSYEAAAATAPAPSLAELERKLGGVYDRRGDWDLAESHFRAAQAALEENDPQSPGTLSRLFADWSRAAHHRDQDGQAAEIASRALKLAEEAGDARALAQAHNLLGLIANRKGDLIEARRHLEESLRLAEALNDPDARAAALNNLAAACREAGDLPRARQLTETALALCASIGDRHREAALHNNLADLYHALGDSAAAMTHLKQAVALFAEVGGEGAMAQPEIWKLTDW
jgi:DNA-binding SARP family transcriptional activator/plasmid stabilization system protein ParE